MKRSLSSRIIGRLKERRDERAPRLAAPTMGAGTHADKPPPMFIIGAQRSGTSLLRQILDSHSCIASPAESKFILPLTAVLKDKKAIHGWSAIGYDQAEVKIAMADFIRGFFDQYASTRGKTRWAEKTPNYVDCLPELWDLFGPNVQFLIILRHGLDTAFSLADPHRHYPALDPYLAAAKGDAAVAAGLFWKDKNRKIEEFRSQHPVACYRLRYEDVTTDPENTLRPMFEFLGEPWEPQAVEYGNFKHHAGYGDPDVKRRSRVEANSGKYKTWPPEVQRAVREACEPMLSSLGYA